MKQFKIEKMSLQQAADRFENSLSHDEPVTVGAASLTRFRDSVMGDCILISTPEDGVAILSIVPSSTA